MDILERIDGLRKAHGWSVNNLAMEAMLTQSTVNSLFVRKTEPKLSTLRAICGAFGISLAEFFADDAAPQRQDDVQNALHSRIDALAPVQQSALLNFLNSL